MSEQRQKTVEERVSAKISALEAYMRGVEPSFKVPRTFSFNWFCRLSEADFETFSKGAPCIRKGAELHNRILDVIKRAEAHRKKGVPTSKRDIDAVKRYKEKIKELEQKIADYDRALTNQVNENNDLREKLAEARRGVGIEQALIADLKTEKGKSKVHSLVDGRK